MDAETIALIKAVGGSGSGGGTGGGSEVQMVHLTWNEDYSQIVSADKTVSEILAGVDLGTAYAITGFGIIYPLAYAAPAEGSYDAEAVFCKVEPSPTFDMSNAMTGFDLRVTAFVGIAKSSGDVWSYYSNSIIDYGQTSLMLRSSTTNSTKIFEIKVDDSGTISAAEVIE